MRSREPRAASRERRGAGRESRLRWPRAVCRWILLGGGPLALLAAARIAHPGTLVVYGRWEAQYKVVAGFPVQLRPYRGAGFEQSVEQAGDGVRVGLVTQPGTVDLDTPPLVSGAAAGQVPASSTAEGSAFVGPVEPLPGEARAEVLRLRSTCKTRRCLAEGVLDWLTRRVQSAESRGQSQAPLDVLERKSANCVGLTRTGIAMLRAAGVPARSVHGFRLQLRDGTVAGGTFHRLLEVEYPGLGWVLSDVGRTKNFLPPDTLILAVEGEELPEEARLVEAAPAEPHWRAVRRVGERRELLTLDEQSWPEDRPLYSAWSPGHRLSWGLIVGTLVAAPPELDIVAVGARGAHRASRAGEWFAFAGLLPGNYTIRVRTERGEARSGPWRLEERQLMRLTLDLGGLLQEGGPEP